MQFIEPIVLQNINKDVAPNGLDYAGRKILNPLRDLLNGRYLSSKDGNTFMVESIKGTVEVPNAQLATGINLCIGTYENIERNLLIFFIWNSNGYHGVFKYDGTTESITRLIVDNPSSPVLNFSDLPQYGITGIGMMGDILVWTDNLNPQRYINITRTYSVLSDYTISLIKIGPTRAPNLVGDTTSSPIPPDKQDDAAVPFNRIADNSFQFAYRYVYLDNEASVLSPYSRVLTADAYGKDVVFSGARNYAPVEFLIDSSVQSVIKRVELCVRLNNEPTWRVWKKVTVIAPTIIADFYNDSPGEIIEEVQSAKVFDTVPNHSRALTIFRSRVFVNISDEGMDVPSLVLTPSIGTDRNTAVEPGTGGTNWPTRGFIKKNGSYSIGAVVSDKFGRYTGVYTKAKLAGKINTMAKTFDFKSANATEANNILANRLNVTLAGALPPDGRLSLVMTEELQYQTYFQTVAALLFYVRQWDNINNSSGEAGTAAINNKLFLYSRSDASNLNNWSNCYFILPDSFPFLPDRDCYVRIINSENQAIIERVVDVLDGGVIVTGKFKGLNLGNYTTSGLQYGGAFGTPPTIGVYAYIEIFKLNTVPSTFYYEVGNPMQAGSDGALPVPAVNDIQGDNFYRGALNLGNDRNLRSFRFPSYGTNEDGAPTLQDETTAAVQIETPSPTYITGSISESTVTGQSQPNKFLQKGYTSDYSKVAWSKGRVFTELTPERVERPATIRFSDSYIEGSNVNGLNSFAFDSVYDKIGQDRSPITKIIPVGNLLIAVHERQVTSLYIGEAIVRTGADGSLTSKVDSVIGDDRKLASNMGSIHPESVREIDGRLFGWDIFTGTVWAYSVEGLRSISSNGMEGFFRDVARTYFPYRNQVKFVGGIDKDNGEYLLTIPDLFVEKLNAPRLETGPPMTLPGSGMQGLSTWADVAGNWAQNGTGVYNTQNAGAPSSTWVKGTLVTVRNYIYNFAYALQIFSDTSSTDIEVEVAILDASEGVLDSVTFPYVGVTGIVGETFQLTPSAGGTHIGIRFTNNGSIDSKTLQINSFTMGNYITVGGSTISYDLVLDSDEFVVGKQYQLTMIPYRQSSPSPIFFTDTIDISLYNDGVTPIQEHLLYPVRVTDPDLAEKLVVQFTYVGQGFIRINIIDITYPLFVDLSIKDQAATGETWAYNYDRKVWTSRYSFVPEYMEKLNNELFSFKGGKMYKHNATETYNNFYGVQYEREFTVMVNPQPNKVKVWSAIQIAATALSTDNTKKVVEVSNDQGQASYMRVREFDKKEGVYYAPILKDINTNAGLISAGKIALRDGKDMRSKSLQVTVRTDKTDVNLLQKVNIVGEYSEFSG